MLECLLAHGATGPLIDSAFLQSCEAQYSDAMHILINHLSNATTVTSALNSMVSKSIAWQLPDGLSIMESLVSHGADKSILKPAFVQAASLFNISAVLMLQHYVCDADTATIAWGEATLASDEWLKDSSVPVLEVLLSCGARVDIDFALTQAVAASINGRELVALVDLLLRHGANPNHNGGQPLRHAAGNGNPELIRMFCQRGPDAEVIKLAFFDLIMGRAQRDASVALTCMQHLLHCPSVHIDLNSSPDGMDLPLIQIITNFPTSPEMVRLAVEAGADVMSKATCPLLLADPDDWRSIGHTRRESMPAGLRLTEDIPALLWALMRTKQELGDDLIETLIDLGGMNETWYSHNLNGLKLTS